MSTQRENPRRALEGGENAYQPFKLVDSTLKKTNLASLLPLTDKNRNTLKDSSNQKGGLQYKSVATTAVQKQTTVYVNKEIKFQTDKTEDTQLQKERQHQHQYQKYQQQEELDLELETNSITQDFFKDNETRYPKFKEQEEEKEEVEFNMIVPILPIVVPQRLRHLYADKNTNNESSNIGSKRSRSVVQEEVDVERENKRADVVPIAEKKQVHSNKELFQPNAPAIRMEITEETKQLEHQEETRAKLSMLQTTNTLKEHQWNDPMLVAEYAGEIFGYFFDKETELMADPNYAFNKQHEISWTMRGVLIDWVIEIHYLFGLLPETLYLTVNIIDRFLSLRTVVLPKLQLVGITALYMAAKFEEIACPNIHDFLFMTDNAVKEYQLIKAERFILQVLDFNLCYPNPVNFLRRVCKEEFKCDLHTVHLAKYFMEVSCIDHHFIGIRPSKIAAASLWLAKKMLGNGKWNSSFSRLAGYTPEELKPTVEAMLVYLSEPVTHDAFFRKWASVRFSKASIFVRDWTNRYYQNE